MARRRPENPPWTRRSLALPLALVVLAISALALVPLPRGRLAVRSGPALADAGSWGYQLQRARPERVTADIDVLVVDHSADGSGARTFTREQVEQFRQREGGRPRIVLAYMSIGEAESYRYYWSSPWTQTPPSWLGPENKTWHGNYLVRFWERGWQRLIFDPSSSLLRRIAELHSPALLPYLDQILEAGFDGVYLDRVDAYEGWLGERTTAERDMVEFVKAIAAYARARRPGFLVVPQNGEELLRHPDYVSVLDGVAKEDLLYGIGGDGVPNAEDDVKASLADLTAAKAAKLPVFVVEYLSDPERRFEAALKLKQLGFVANFADRQLGAAPEAAGVPAGK